MDDVGGRNELPLSSTYHQAPPTSGQRSTQSVLCYVDFPLWVLSGVSVGRVRLRWALLSSG